MEIKGKICFNPNFVNLMLDTEFIIVYYKRVKELSINGLSNKYLLSVKEHQMNRKTIIANKIIISLFFLLIFAKVSFAQYANYRLIEPREGDEPLPKAIVWNKGKAHALIFYKDDRINAVEKARLDKEWSIKEIKRESIIFGRTSQRRFIEYYINSDKRPNKRYASCSFYCSPITLWEAVHLLCDAFEYNTVMHNICGGTVSVQRNGESFNTLLNSIIPKGVFTRLEVNTLYVLPLNTPNEKPLEILERKKSFNYKVLAMRFPGLEKEGTVISIGNDIQYVLRVIALGGQVPISFPKDLHFSVYSNYKKVPFYKILSDIVYANQCIIVERERGLEIMPWRVEQYPVSNNLYWSDNYPPLPPLDELITADPDNIDEKSGSGPYPPPLIDDPRFGSAPVVRSMGYFSDENGHPIVIQPCPAVPYNSNKSGDSE
ncbi:MAG: hypothetical protein J6Z11_04165 [Candidatus Riflebacteria bacterium]|nr:hypothetical protein [Candidatus Riflebacteria bacterium]